MIEPAAASISMRIMLQGQSKFRSLCEKGITLFNSESRIICNYRELLRRSSRQIGRVGWTNRWLRGEIILWTRCFRTFPTRHGDCSSTRRG